MKFLCGSCRTKYQISDEKVRGKILTIRCKKCGAKILVRESLMREAQDGPALAPVAETSAPAPASKPAAADTMLESAYQSGMARMPAGEVDDMPTSIAPVPSDAGLAGFEWYLAIDGQQHGPYAYAELAEKVRTGRVEGRHYVWHDGMSDWTRVRDLPDLARMIGGAVSSPPPPKGVEEAGGPTEVSEIPIDLSLSDAPVAPAPSAAPQPAAPEPALAVSRTDDVVRDPAEPAEAPSLEAEATPLGTADLDLAMALDDDIFANVPRASEGELVQRESTKFFVAAAGVTNEKKKNRLGLMIGAALAASLAVFMGLWMTGVIRVSLPGIGNPFAKTEDTTAQTLDGSADDGDYALLLGEVEVEPVDANGRRTRRRPRRRSRSEGGSALDKLGEGGYIDDEGDGSGSTRGGTTRDEEGAPTVSIGSLGAKLDIDDGPGSLTRLPTEVDLEAPPPDVDALDASIIQRVVASKKTSVRLCYERSLKAKESLKGKLQVSLVVEPSGRVARARIASPSFRGSVVGECIVTSIRTWRFPQFQGSAQEIELPFVFQRGV